MRLPSFANQTTRRHGMIRTRKSRGRRWATLLGFCAGACIGMTVLAGGVVSAQDGAADAPAVVERGLRDVLHTPPSLAREGGSVDLRYDVVCQADALGTPCAPKGSAFVRRADQPSYHAVPLALAGEATLAATVIVPAGGLSYYAVIEDGAGNSLTVPPAGAAAPQRAWAFPDAID